MILVERTNKPSNSKDDIEVLKQITWTCIYISKTYLLASCLAMHIPFS